VAELGVFDEVYDSVDLVLEVYLDRSLDFSLSIDWYVVTEEW